MPYTLEVFLSWKILPILGIIYILSGLIVIWGFKWRKITRRRDVKLRAALMLGTFIYLSQSIGVMVSSITYLFLKINQVNLTLLVSLVTALVSLIVCDVIYVFISNYLWDRLAIAYRDGIRLSIVSLILVTPWYFILNLT